MRTEGRIATTGHALQCRLSGDGLFLEDGPVTGDPLNGRVDG